MKGQSNEGDPLLANNRHQGTDSPPEEKNESGATRLTSSSSTPGEDETVEAHGEVAGMESALGLLFLQQTGGLGVGLPTGAAPGTFPVPLPRGDITQAITLRISQLLAVQLVMEERVLFPILRCCGANGRKLAEEAQAEHPAMMNGLTDLQNTHFMLPTFGPTIEPLIALIAKRNGREEGEIQACLQANLTSDEVGEVNLLVDRVRERKGADADVDARVRVMMDHLRARMGAST